MAALWNRAGHYILQLRFLSSFFPRIISAVGDWMTSTHNVVLVQIQNTCMKCAAHGLLNIQNAKITPKSSSVHHRTTMSGYIFTIKARIDNRKKTVKWQYLLHMSSQYAELRPINSWDVLVSLRHPSKFQRLSCLGFVTAPTSLNGRQPHFARSLAVSCTGILYIHFRGLLPDNGILQQQNSLCVPSLLFFYIGSITAGHSSSGHHPQFAVWHKQWNYGTFADGATYIQQGGPSCWASAQF